MERTREPENQRTSEPTLTIAPTSIILSQEWPAIQKQGSGSATGDGRRDRRQQVVEVLPVGIDAVLIEDSKWGQVAVLVEEGHLFGRQRFCRGWICRLKRQVAVQFLQFCLFLLESRDVECSPGG